MSQNALSAQGTTISRAPAATPTVFTVIAEVRAVTPPAATRKAIDLSAHNDTDEAFTVSSLKRKTPMTFTIGWIPTNGTHDKTTGLRKAYEDKTLDLYRVTYPDNSTETFSGWVTNLGPKAPMEDGLTMDVEIRPTGIFVLA